MITRQEVTARAIIALGGYVLVAKGKDDAFCHLPGGHVEAGEMPVAAVMREIQEEMGRVCQSVQPVGMIENVFDKGNVRVQEQMHMFHVKLWPALQEVPARSAEEWLEFFWRPIGELSSPPPLLPPAVYGLIRHYGGA